MAKKFFTSESFNTLVNEFKKYADAAANKVKNDLLNGAGEAYDTLKELGDLIDDNQDAIGALETVATNKADKDHTHSFNDLTDKPFYETEPVETVILPEASYAFSSNWMTYKSTNQLSDGLSLEIGKTYNVNWDGTAYNGLVCFDDNGTPTVGAAMSTLLSGQYPFMIKFNSYDDGNYLSIETPDTSATSHTVGVIGSISELVPLDRKFIAEYLYEIPGEKTAGKEYNIYNPVTYEENTYTAANGAEIFNNYADNRAVGEYSHAEGYWTIAVGRTSHAEGNQTFASGEASHVEGISTIASGDYSHAEGEATHASSTGSHAEGSSTIASGTASHAEGLSTRASSTGSHAEGGSTKASSEYQHVQGKYNVEDAASTYAHIVGNGSSDTARSNAHTLDWEGNAWFQGDVYIGGSSQTDEAAKKLATEDHSHSWNDLQDRPFYTADPVETDIIPETTFTGTSKVIDSNISSLTIGETYTVVWDGTTYDNLVCKNVSGLAAIGASDFNFTDYPFLIGIDNGNCNLMASTDASHTVKVTGMVSEVIPLDRKYIAEYLDTLPVYAGQKVAGKEYTVDDEQVIAGNGAEIFNNYSSNIASASYAHAEGSGTLASGTVSHAEGYQTVAKGGYSHAQGYKTQATGNRAHAEGQGSVASGDESHAEGTYTIAAGDSQHVQGKYNVEDTAGTYAHIVGNGSNVNNRKNAHTLDWDGNAEFAGDVKVNACGGENPISLVALYEEVQALKALLVDGNEVAY